MSDQSITPDHDDGIAIARRLVTTVAVLAVIGTIVALVLVLVQVQASADDLAVPAQEALDGSGTDLWLLRLLVLAIGAGVAAAYLAARRALHAFASAGGGTRTHTPSGTGS